MTYMHIFLSLFYNMDSKFFYNMDAKYNMSIGSNSNNICKLGLAVSI